MSVRSRYFVFNKESDYQKGFFQNTQYTQTGGLRIADPQAKEAAVFFSRVLDSRESQSLWHRMTVQSESLGDSSIRFSFYVSEERTVQYRGQRMDLLQLIRDPGISAAEKQHAFAPYFVRSVLNPGDMLLSEAKGRYLWFTIELFGLGAESPVIRHMRISLPSLPWAGYLPEIYQADGSGRSFTERFLSIFQSFYDDLDEKLDRVAEVFDPAAADGEILRWLASWIDLDDPFLWTEEQLRWLVMNSASLYRRRGTRQSVSDMVELYTGQKPLIVEQYETDKFRDNDRLQSLMHQLYGDHPYQFTVIVNEECVPSNAEYRTILRIIDCVKPAEMEVNLVVLKPYIFLSRYSYLGINSVLGQYRQAALDGFSTLPFTELSEDSGGREYAVKEGKGEES
ncbi:MAG: phage tail protein [Anaerovoracaceae bacterium]